MLKLNSKGFGLLEALLILIILALIGGAGYYVYKAQQNTNDTLDETGNSEFVPSKQDEQKSEESVDPTADWIEYTDPDGKYSLKYPNTWTTAKNQDLCNPSLLLLGVKLDNGKSTAGICASEGFGQISVAAYGNTNTQAYSLFKVQYKNYASEDVTVAGASGTKQTGVFKGGGTSIGPGPAVGTKTIKYVLVKDGYTYVLSYGQAPGQPDAQKDFELLVNDTFEIK